MANVEVPGPLDLAPRRASSLQRLLRYAAGPAEGQSAWGRGYATEAARAAIGWVLDHTATESIVATTHPENAASQRVLAKLGFVSAGEVEGQFHQLRLFRLSISAFRGD